MEYFFTHEELQDESVVPVMTIGDNVDGTALKQTTVFTSACALNLYLDHAAVFAEDLDELSSLW